MKNGLILGAMVAALTIFVTYQWAQGVVDSGPTATSLTIATLLILAPILALIVGAGIGAWSKLQADERRRGRS
jgi:hypothetical protein